MAESRVSPPLVRPVRLALAAAATVVVVALFWIFEPSMLWMGGVLAAAIWMPLVADSEEPAPRWALPALATGIALLVIVGLVVWIA